MGALEISTPKNNLAETDSYSVSVTTTLSSSPV
jgi:hypothetical protein